MTEEKKKFDVISIGGGIASHTAAIYAGRAGLSTLVIFGLELDQLSLTSSIENFPGFPDGIVGSELIQQAKQQAQKFGAQYLQENVASVSKTGSGFEVTAAGKKYYSKTVIVCTGASPRKLGVPGEEEYFGKGISTCATCDAPLYKDKEVVVIGGGDVAMEEALALYKFAKKITIIHRRNEFRASKIMQDRVLKLADKIAVVWDSAVLEVIGGDFVTGIKIKNVKTNEETNIPCGGVFLAIGHIPNTSFLGNLVELEKGYIKVDGVRTSVPGIFAAGDVMDHIYKQAITSAGRGCMAALEAEKFIVKLQLNSSP
jgi:thioredoxin reductase (NADPH)